MEVVSSVQQKATAVSRVRRKLLRKALSWTSFDKKAAYVYDSLKGEDVFRLVNLEPGRGSDKLHCSIHIYPLSTAPAYEALSYGWGDSKQTCQMRCDGKVIFITPTLEVALHRLRLRRTSRLLWIDQLCIDQSNIEERNQQVNIMNKIYERAARVLIWLGPADDENAALAFDFIHKINDRNPTAIDLQTFDFPPDHFFTARGLPPRSSRKWDALSSMSNLPYFTRAWVVQELIVASEAWVLWGESEIEWPVFYCVLEWLVQNGCAFLDPQGRPSLNFVNLRYMLSVHEDTNLLGWLCRTRGKEATDARDKVHAVLGLAEDVQTDIPQAIKADYDKSEADLYRNVTRYCIGRHRNLDILSYNLHNAPRPGDHSSWAPVWQNPDPDLDQLVEFIAFNFRAGRETEASYQDTGESSLLFLRGMKIDTVATGCVAFGHNQCNNGQISIPIVDAWRYTRARFDDPYQAQPHASLIWAFIRTLMADRRFSNLRKFSATPATETSVLPFANFVTKHLLAFLTEPAVLRQLKQCPRDILHCVEAASARGTSLFPKQNQKASNPGEGRRWCKQQAKKCHPDNDLAAEAAAAHLDSLLHYPGDDQLFRSSFELISPGRKFYTTKNGSMGLGPSAMRGGDIICVLFGGTVPYILRPNAGGEYSFVGDCYIDGFMNGEAIDKWEAAELAAEWFPLR